jgi:serine/threonine protein kinase
VYHRDLKPDNVMMTEEGLPLLIDFEFSSFDRSLHSGLSAMSSHCGFVGTRWYAAPESLDDEKHKPQRSAIEKEVGRDHFLCYALTPAHARALSSESFHV